MFVFILLSQADSLSSTRHRVHRPFFDSPSDWRSRFPASFEPDPRLIRPSKNAHHSHHNSKKIAKKRNTVTLNTKHSKTKAKETKSKDQLCYTDSNCHSKNFQCVRVNNVSLCQRKSIDPLAKGFLAPLLFLVFVALLGSLPNILFFPLVVLQCTQFFEILGTDILFLVRFLQLLLLIPGILAILIDSFQDKGPMRPPPLHPHLLLSLLPAAFLGKYFAGQILDPSTTYLPPWVESAFTTVFCLGLASFIIWQTVRNRNWKSPSPTQKSQKTNIVGGSHSIFNLKEPRVGIEFGNLSSTFHDIQFFDRTFGNHANKKRQRHPELLFGKLDAKNCKYKLAQTIQNDSGALENPSDFEGLSFIKVNMEARMSKEEIYRKYNLSGHRKRKPNHKSIEQIDQDIVRVNSQSRECSQFRVDKVLRLTSESAYASEKKDSHIFNPLKSIVLNSKIFTPKSKKKKVSKKAFESESPSLKNYSEVCKPKFKRASKDFINIVDFHSYKENEYAGQQNRQEIKSVFSKNETKNRKENLETENRNQAPIKNKKLEREISHKLHKTEIKQKLRELKYLEMKENQSQGINRSVSKNLNTKKLNISSIIRTQNQNEKEVDRTIKSLKLNSNKKMVNALEKNSQLKNNEVNLWNHRVVDSESTKKIKFGNSVEKEKWGSDETPSRQVTNWNRFRNSSSFPKSSKPSEYRQISTQQYKYQIEKYNFFKTQQFSVVTPFNVKLLMGTLMLIAQVVLADTFLSPFFKNPWMLQIFLVSEALVFSIWVYFKLRLRQFKAKDWNVQVDTLSNLNVFAFTALVCAFFATCFVGGLSKMQSDVFWFGLLLLVSPDVYRNCLTLSLLGFPSLVFFLSHGPSFFWKSNPHFLVVIGGLTLFYGLFLRVMYGMSFKRSGWQRGILLVILLYLGVSLVLTLSLPSEQLDIFYVDKKIYKQPWIKVSSI